MANTRGPLNSSQPSNGIVVSGVYNAVAPAPADEQPCALQVDDEGNLLVNVIAGTIIATGIPAAVSTIQGWITTMQTNLESGLISVGAITGSQTPGYNVI